MSDIIVEVEQGKLRGKLCRTANETTFYTFKGIPYAKPPVGELRFAIPEPPLPWEGVRDATVNCNICLQYDRFAKVSTGDEDCLYLNVYTPKLAKTGSSLPVMFFIHGGGFVFGHGTDETAHGPDFLIEKPVVIVTINYRLGILGFLSLNCKEAPGNMGLRDQVQALKWVQKNINKFGGDPNNVTIFGISAGAASVEYLLLSQSAKGLFHKAIAQGGSPLSPWAHSNKIQELASKIPVLNGKSVPDHELLDYLKKMPAGKLVISSMMALACEKFKGGINFGFVPTVEKPGDWEPFIDKPAYDLLKSGEFIKVPMMTGFASREGLLMTSLGSNILEKLVKDKSFIDHLEIKDDVEKDGLRVKFKKVYFEEDNVYKDDDYFAIDFFTDEMILGGVYTAATLINKNNAPVYFYEFSYDGNLNYVKKIMNINRKSACHADEGGYLLKHSMLTEDLTNMDRLVRDRMIELWTNFAKYGHPTPEINALITTKWEPFSSTKTPCLVIGENLTMKEEVYPARMKLFQEFYEKYRC